MRKTKLMLDAEKKVGMDLGYYLRREYVKEEKSIKDISRQLDVVNTTLSTWLKRYHLHARKIGLPHFLKELDDEIKEIRKANPPTKRKRKTIEKNPAGYWKSQENALTEAIKVINKHSFVTLPSNEILCGLGYDRLATAIFEYHRGIHEFRKLLREEQKRKDLELPHRTMKKTKEMLDAEKKVGTDLGDYLLREFFDKRQKALSIGNEIGVPETLIYDWLDKYGIPKAITRPKPTGQELFDLHVEQGKSIAEISKEKNEDPKIIIECFKFYDMQLYPPKNLKYAIQKAKRVMKKHKLKTFPGAYKLNKLGYSKLVNAIETYHDGLPEFRKLIHQRLGIKSTKQELLEDLMGYARQ